MKKISNFNSQKGLTLIEIAVALVILFVALLAMAQVIAVTITTNARSRDLMKASILCKQKMEQLISLGYSDTSTNTSGNLIANSDGTFSYPTTGGSGLANGGTVAPNPYLASSTLTTTTNYVDYLDKDGNVVTASGNYIYIRLWKVATSGTVKTIEVTVVGRAKTDSFKVARVVTMVSN